MVMLMKALLKTVHYSTSMDFSEFDKKSQEIFEKKEITYYFNPHFNTEGNCNTSTTTILYKSGVSKV